MGAVLSFSFQETAQIKTG